MYNIVICDDDSSFVEHMKNMLLEGGMKGEYTNFYEYNSRDQLVEAMDGHTNIDLLILDIQIGKINGYQIAKKFREQFAASILIFCSNVFQATTECFEVLPYRYLLKCFTDERMLKEIRQIVCELKIRNREPIIVGQYFQNTIRLKPEEILYIAIAKRGSHIYINPEVKKYGFEDKIVSKKRLEEIYLLLKEEGFVYAHNSYIVNCRYIKRITVKELEMYDGTRLSISRSKGKTFRKEFAQWLTKKCE